MGQIEMSTDDMLADDNPSFTGTPDILKAIAAAMSNTCPRRRQPATALTSRRRRLSPVGKANTRRILSVAAG
jgi:hypothetical protein